MDSRTTVTGRPDPVSKTRDALAIFSSFFRPVRGVCQAIVGSPDYYNVIAKSLGQPTSSHFRRTPFNVFILLAIIVSVVLAATASPWEQRRLEADGNPWFRVADLVLLVIFGVEFLLRVIADGLIRRPYGYFRNEWNILDFFVFLTYFVSAFSSTSESTGLPRALRAARALRPLRIIASFPAMRDIVVTLVKGLPKILDALILTFITSVPCAIYGVYLFSGRLFSCNDSNPSIFGIGDCVGDFIATPDAFGTPLLVPRTWENPQFFSFDNFGAAALSVFQLMSTEGWTEMAFYAMTVVGVDKQPQQNAAPYLAIYFVVVICIASILGLNLFVGIIVYHFELESGTALLTNDQRRWLDLQKHLSIVHPSARSARPDPKTHRFRTWCYDIASRKTGVFANFITGLIVFNTVLMCTEFKDNPALLVTIRSILYVICCFCYLVDVLIKLVGFGVAKWRANFWNIYDAISVTGGLITSAMIAATYNSYIVLQLQKVFLVLIAFKLVQRLDALQTLFKTLIIAIPSLLNIAGIVFMVLIVYALLFQEIFGLMRHGDVTDTHANFWFFGNAMVTLFRILTIDDWQRVFHDLMMEAPYCEETLNNYLDSDCGSTGWAYALVLSFFVISTYLLLNMFVVVIVSHFSYTYQRNAVFSLLSRADIRGFKRVWARIDKDNTGFVKTEELPKLLSQLDGKFRIRIYDDQFQVPEIVRQVFGRPVGGAQRNSGRSFDVGGSRRKSFAPPVMEVKKLWEPSEVPVDRLNAALENLGELDTRDDIHIRRVTYNYIYKECMRAARIVQLETGVDKGVPFNAVLKILSYELVEMEKSLQIDELVERRRLLTHLYVSMAAEKLKGFMIAAHYRKLFKSGRLNPELLRRRRDLVVNLTQKEKSGATALAVASSTPDTLMSTAARTATSGRTQIDLEQSPAQGGRPLSGAPSIVPSITALELPLLETLELDGVGTSSVLWNPRVTSPYESSGSFSSSTPQVSGSASPPTEETERRRKKSRSRSKGPRKDRTDDGKGKSSNGEGSVRRKLKRDGSESRRASRASSRTSGEASRKSTGAQGGEDLGSRAELLNNP